MFVLTVSMRHSVPANMAPTMAKFLPYDKDLAFISFRTALVVGVSWPGTTVDMGSIPAVNKPKTAPKAPPEGENESDFIIYACTHFFCHGKYT